MLSGGDGADAFLFSFEDEGANVITDFEFGVDKIAFETSANWVTPESLLHGATQVGNDVELTLSDQVITIQDTLVTDLTVDDFMIL